MYRCDFECLGVVHRRQQSRQPARQHGLAGSRRTNHEDVVCARGAGRSIGASAMWPRRYSTTSVRGAAANVVAMPRAGTPRSCLRWAPQPTVRPIRSAASVEGSTPDVERKSPPKPSSPTNSRPASASAGRQFAAARMAIAIARSKRPPRLDSSAGARLMLMNFCGKSNPALINALRTRSRLSFTLVSARPTMLTRGRWTSMSTGGDLMPTRVRVWATAKDGLGRVMRVVSAGVAALCAAAGGIAVSGW